MNACEEAMKLGPKARKGTVGFCRKHLAPEHLKGFLMAPRFFALKEWQEKNLQALAQVEERVRSK